MNYRKIDETTDIIDITTENDNPYNNWKTDPLEKFIEELLEEGYNKEEIYNIDINGEEGIIIDYDLYPHEILRWDRKEKNMKLKMKHPTLHQYKKALRDLGIIYDEEYWGK